MARKTRTDFQSNRNRTFAKLKHEGNLSYTDIALNRNYNPGKLTPQRIQQIVKDWDKRSQKASNDE